MAKERLDNSDYSPQTSPNQFKAVELINTDKDWYNSDKNWYNYDKTDLIMTFAASGQVFRIFDTQNFLIFWKQSDIHGVPTGCT